MKHIRAFKFRLYPTRVQAQTLDWHLRLHRELYNAALSERREAYRMAGKSVSVYEQMRSLPEVKEARPEFRDLNAQTLQATLKRLDRAFGGFFGRVKAGQTPGFPRFQGRERFDSMTYPQLTRDEGSPPRGGGVRWVGAGKPVAGGTKVYLPKIGNVRLKMHRPLEGSPKTLTVKREGAHWYAVYTCEVEIAPLPATGSTIGFDLGTSPNFLITSDGEFVPAPRRFRQAQAKLRRAQRVVSRRKRRSKRQGKARGQVARIHRKVANQRRDFHHKTARTLINQHDTLVHEDLNIIGLARSRTAKGVLDAGWASFLSILSQKAEWATRRVVAVQPRYTSQDCSGCGSRQKVPIGKPYRCEGCGYEGHRDVNAALNILARGLDGAFGESTPTGAAH